MFYPSKTTYSMSWLDYKNAKKELIESCWFSHNYWFYKVKDLQNFLEIINYPYDILFIKKLYRHVNTVTSTFIENYKFLKNVGKINDAISIENPTKILDLIKEFDYDLKYSCYMYHLYYTSMSNTFVNDEERLEHRIVKIYDWYKKDKIDVHPVVRGSSISYKNMKCYTASDFFYSQYEFDPHIINLIKNTYSSNVTNILITNFINGELIDKHNYTGNVELKRNLFHFIFIEIIQQIRRNSYTQYKEKYTLTKEFYDFLEAKFDIELGYKSYIDANYNYFDTLSDIKEKIIEKIKDA